MAVNMAQHQNPALLVEEYPYRGYIKSGVHKAKCGPNQRYRDALIEPCKGLFHNALGSIPSSRALGNDTRVQFQHALKPGHNWVVRF